MHVRFYSPTGRLSDERTALHEIRILLRKRREGWRGRGWGLKHREEKENYHLGIKKGLSSYLEQTNPKEKQVLYCRYLKEGGHSLWKLHERVERW